MVRLRINICCRRRRRRQTVCLSHACRVWWWCCLWCWRLLCDVFVIRTMLCWANKAQPPSGWYGHHHLDDVNVRGWTATGCLFQHKYIYAIWDTGEEKGTRNYLVWWWCAPFMRFLQSEGQVVCLFFFVIYFSISMNWIWCECNAMPFCCGYVYIGDRIKKCIYLKKKLLKILIVYLLKIRVLVRLCNTAIPISADK